MKLTIATPLQQAHEASQDELRRARLRGELNTEFVSEKGIVLVLADRLDTAVLPMREEHKTIVACSHPPVQHGRIEDAVMYPAAVLAGHQVRVMRGQRADLRVSP